MGFLEHLQSRIILGTYLYEPHSASYDWEAMLQFKNALESNDHEQIKTLLLEGFCVDTPLIPSHETALIFALRHKKRSMALLLLAFGASPYVHTVEGFTPKMLSKDQKTLCDYFNRPLVQTDIFSAVHKADMASLWALLHQGESLDSVNAKKQTLLHLAVLSNDSAMVTFLLNKNLSIDAQDKFGHTPLMYAVLSFERMKIVALLIARGATLDQRNYNHHTALTLGIKKGHLDAVALLIRQGACLNIRCGIHTPLALLQEQLELAQSPQTKERLRALLVYFYTHGAHVNATADAIKWTALHLCAHYYDAPFYISSIKRLLALGAHVDATDAVGRTPLMLSASFGRTQSLKLFIHAGAQLDILDKYGWTALMLAVFNNHLECVMLLVDAGCDINRSSHKELNALKIARDQKHTQLATYLKLHGAQEA